MALQSKGSVIAAIVQILEDLNFDGGAFDGQNLFESVIKFDRLSVRAAVKKALVFEKRIALVVPTQSYWKPPILKGNVLVTLRTMQVNVILIDRDYSNLGSDAFFGDDTNFPGVFDVMADPVTEALTGSFIEGNSEVAGTPTGEAAVYLALSEKEEEKANGRDGYVITFEISCGQIRKPLQRGRTART